MSGEVRKKIVFSPDKEKLAYFFLALFFFSCFLISFSPLIYGEEAVEAYLKVFFTGPAFFVLCSFVFLGGFIFCVFTLVDKK